MKLTAEEARELTWHQPGMSATYLTPNLTVESNEQVSSRRWVSVHQLVVKDADGKYWAATYERGLTENQDIEPFEDVEEVEFSQVVKIPITAYAYKGMGLVDSEA